MKTSTTKATTGMTPMDHAIVNLMYVYRFSIKELAGVFDILEPEMKRLVRQAKRKNNRALDRLARVFLEEVK